MAFRALVVDVDGNTHRHEWDDSQPVLARLQTAVGGYVDVVNLSPELDMWVNDSGILNGLPLNDVASQIAALFGKGHQPYFGPAVFTRVDDDGESAAPLTADQVVTLMDMATLIRPAPNP